MYAEIATATGWTWDYIRHNMTLLRYVELMRYWRRNPPVHRLVAWFMGYEAPAEERQTKETSQASDSLEDLMRDFAAAGGVMN